jgi:exosortase/archaeosortase family protein
LISLFFGEFFRLTALRRALCVLAGFALSFLFNMARTTLLTWVAAKKGVPAVASWHDPAGVTILVGCFLTLWLTATWLRGKNRKQKAESRSQKSEVGSQGSGMGSTSPRPSPQRGDGALPSTLNSQPSTVPVRLLAIGLLA